MPKLAELSVVNASPDTPSINQPPVRIIIRKQQRSEPRPRALGISPADHHELLAVLAFDLHPQAAIAGRIGSVGALGDDALQRQFAGPDIELRAASNLVIAVLQRRSGVREQISKALLSLT